MNVYNVTNCKWKEYIVSNALKKDWIFSVFKIKYAETFIYNRIMSGEGIKYFKSKKVIPK